ncbi:MAG: CRISPR-associated endonuclease Cas3'', partial [Clostridia bacterium]|nr:CRISPR-associated endonuclease Cas3'' [Clostridia bacterium]
MIDLKCKIENLYAKSNPKETIREHTDNLLCQVELLKKYGYISNESLYEDLLVSCEYHDYGKVNEKFQKRIQSPKYCRMTDMEVPHNVLSAFLVDEEKCNEYINVLFAVLHHHYRNLSPINYINSNGDIILEELEKIMTNLDNEELEDFFDGRELDLTSDVADKLDEKTEIKKDLILLKGFLHKCDYSASAGIDCEIKNDFLDKTMQQWQETLHI